MDASTLITRLETATASFQSLERQLADPDVAADPKRLGSGPGSSHSCSISRL